ncbi:MAG: hypothetical protein C4326_06910 [Ignavibacteria bacterium]
MHQPTMVSIIIVHYNGLMLLRRCLASVFAQPYRPIEVIVVDNASSDGSVEMVKNEFPAARVIALNRNTGFAEGNNIGVREAVGEYLVLLNNDTEVDAQWLPPLLDLMQQPRVAIAASKVLTDGVPQAFYEMNGTINYLGYNIMRQFTDLSMVFYAGGTSLMFRRSIAGEPFLDEYFLYHEDVYLSWRMRLRGFEVRMAQASLVHHRGSQTTRREASALITFYQTRNRVLNLLILYEASTLLKLLPMLLADVLATAMRAAFSVSWSFSGVMRAYAWIATHLGWLRARRKEEQAARRVSDADILKLMSADVVDATRSAPMLRPLNILSRTYAQGVRLPFYG